MLERAAQAALARHPELPPVGLTIVITGDAQIQQLNRDYREIDAPTDVLSFPASYIDPETSERYLGDILISYPQAASQATTAGHPVSDEIQLLVIHGVLHLLGYDHLEAPDQERMWEIQAEILIGLGLQPGKLVA